VEIRLAESQRAPAATLKDRIHFAFNALLLLAIYRSPSFFSCIDDPLAAEVACDVPMVLAKETDSRYLLLANPGWLVLKRVESGIRIRQNLLQRLYDPAIESARRQHVPMQNGSWQMRSGKLPAVR
jgi:hypothetical protein